MLLIFCAVVVDVVVVIVTVVVVAVVVVVVAVFVDLFYSIQFLNNCEQHNFRVTSCFKKTPTLGTIPRLNGIQKRFCLIVFIPSFCLQCKHYK